jgi:proline iminopeptidase
MLLLSFLFLATVDVCGQVIKYVKLPEGHQIWTKTVGQGDKKILLIHGGPGNTHEYFEIFEKRLPLANYQLIFYDQLGSFNSDNPNDTSLFKIQRFVDEIEQIRQTLNINENLFLLGHSWGGLLAMEYSLKYPENIRGLIISNKSFSQERLIQTTEKLWDSIALTFPNGKRLLYELDNGLKISDTITEQAINEKFNNLYRCRLDSIPDAIKRSRAHTNKKIRVLDRDDWTIEQRLGKIKTPTLIIGAKYDFVDEADLNFMASKISHSQLYICPNGSHFAFWDDSENYFRTIEMFIDKVAK